MKKYIYPAILVVTIGVGVVLMYNIWAAVAPRSTAQFVESGKQYFDQGKYPEAIVEFQNALQKDAGDKQARLLLARSLLVQNDTSGAVKQLKSLLEYHPDDRDASLQLGNIYLQGGGNDPQFFREAKSIAEKIIETEPSNVLAMILLGNAQAGLRDYTSSISQFEQALKLDPQNAAILVSMGATQAVQKNYPEAEQAFLKARQIDPKNVSALISLASYYQVSGKNAEAENMFKEALAAHPANRQVYLPAVVFYLQTKRQDQAVQLLKVAQASSPTDPSPFLLLASLYRSQKSIAEATTVLAETKAKFPKNSNVAVAYAEILMASDLPAANKEVEAIVAKDPSNFAAQVLRGEIQYLSRDFDKALATLDTPSIMGARYPQAHFLVGQIQVSKGQREKALDHFQKSLEIDPRFNAGRLALAELLLNMGRFADAEVELRKVLETDPNSVIGRLLKANVETFQGRFENAEKILTAVQKEQPDNAQVHLQAGVYYQSRGRKAEAEMNLLQALKLQPDSDDILRHVVEYYDSQKATDRALEIINTTVPDSKKRAFHYELAGVAYSRVGRLQDAEPALKKALALEPDRVNSHVSLANVYIGLRRYDEALKQLDELLKLGPNNANAYTMKGMIYQTREKEDLPSAKDNYERALKADPNSFVAANNLAYVLAEQGQDLQVAVTYAQTARRLRPNDSASADTLGWIQYKLGRHQSAREQLQFAVSKEPNNPTYQYHLGLIYKETKQLPEARAALQKAAGTKEGFKEKALAEAALKELR